MIFTAGPHFPAMQAERVAKLASLHGLEQELAAARRELAQYADNDPQKVDAMRTHLIGSQAFAS